ncbi:MAG: hypothetical protein HC927_11070 [Deltaproteobacteria bacterium]|nr:hypothetical protein [Deltaproteobacteria bacterium]
MPLWAEILGVVVGAGLIVTGNTLLALDGKCKDGGDPATCPILIENTAHGATFATVGAGISVFFSVALGVDHLRAAQSQGRTAGSQWTLRF